MFTGLIKDQGSLSRRANKPGSQRLTIRTQLDLSNIEIGASVACDGCCLTVVGKGDDSFDVEVSNETLEKTVIGNWRDGQMINLEPSLKVGDELGGHLVTGHVDGKAVLESVREDGDSYRLRLRVPEDLKAFIAPKGSVSLNGISLTVNEVEDDVFGVNIIPHTWQETNIQNWQEGTEVNLEIDIMARYVARLLDVRGTAQNAAEAAA